MSIQIRLPDLVVPSGSKCMDFSAVFVFSTAEIQWGSYVVSDLYAQLIVPFLLSPQVEQVANVVLYSSDYYTKVVASEEAQ